VHEISVIMPSTWLEQISPGYGEHELFTKFLITYNNKFENTFCRSYKDSCGKEIEHDLQSLFSSISTLPVSRYTALCERGFSKIYVVCTLVRSFLSTENLSSLLFISLVGPPLLGWDPLSSVQAWLCDGRRHANYTACMARQHSENVKEAS